MGATTTAGTAQRRAANPSRVRPGGRERRCGCLDGLGHPMSPALPDGWVVDRFTVQLPVTADFSAGTCRMGA